MTDLPGLPREAMFTLGRSALDAIIRYWPEPPAARLPGRRLVSNGIVFWDCEQLAVTVERAYGVDGDVQGEQWIQMDVQAGFRGLVLGVYLMRAVPDASSENLGDEVQFPPADDITASAFDLYGDAVDVWKCLQYAHKQGELATVNAFAFQDWTPLGPEGGFGGGLTRCRALLL